MGFRGWLNRLFARPEPADTVPFYDVDSGTVVQIPRRELRPDAVEVHIQAVDGLVWVLPDQLQQGPVQHPPFADDLREYTRQMKTTFSEHLDQTLDEWEDGFRRDANPEREIALWSHAADVYVEFAADEQSEDRRADICRCIIACMTTSPESVWSVLETSSLGSAEAKRIVERFYGKDA